MVTITNVIPPDALWLRFARRPRDLADVLRQSRITSIMNELSQVIETRELSTADYDALIADLSATHAWLDGKGGSHKGCLQVIKVVSAQRRTLYINPEGYDYARYVAVADA